MRISVVPAGAALLLAAGLLTLVPAAADPPVPVSMATLRAPAAFSPDGNGVKDTAKVKFTLPAAGTATLQIRSTSGSGSIRVFRAVHFGRLAAGKHVWRWDGRDQRGRMMPEGRYQLRLKPGTDPRTPQDYVVLDTSFSAGMYPEERYALPASRGPVQVFPRTTVVRDGVDLRVSAGLGASDATIRRVRLVIEDSDGDVVLKRRRASLDRHWTVRWTARRGGRALPPGRYTAFVRGRDALGNAGRSRGVPIQVRGERLVWREETRVLAASEPAVGACRFTSANGCWDFPEYGTVVPSERYPQGLSFRSVEGPEPLRSFASEVFYVGVPETAGVRGVHSARVTFTGSPTVTGEDDHGRLLVWGADTSVTSSSTATTPWTTVLSQGKGGLSSAGVPRYDPGVAWSFATTDTDSFDVDTFTVDLRYLVPRG